MGAGQSRDENRLTRYVDGKFRMIWRLPTRRRSDGGSGDRVREPEMVAE
jgi:hypothetical protein